MQKQAWSFLQLKIAVKQKHNGEVEEQDGETRSILLTF